MVDLLTSLKAEADSGKTGALVAAAANLDLYMFRDKQPDLEFFKAVRLLDPNQYKLLENSFDTVKDSLPMLSDMRTEWLIYASVVKELPTEKVEPRNVWPSVAIRIPQFSTRTLALCRIAYSSAGVEHSFNKYNQILSSQRTCTCTRLTQDSLRYQNALYHNC